MTKPKRFTISLTYSEITRIAEAMQKMVVIKPEGPWILIRRKLIDQLSQQEVERVEMKHLTRCSECRYAIPVEGGYECEHHDTLMQGADYCSWGARRKP